LGQTCDENTVQRSTSHMFVFWDDLDAATKNQGRNYNPHICLARNYTECFPGEYQDQTGQGSCKSCARGFYNAEDAQVACKICPMGYANAQKKQSLCKICTPGKYATNTATQICTSCPIGWFDTVGAPGATSSGICDKCLAGQYTGEGTTSCTDCEIGTYLPDENRGLLGSCLGCEAVLVTGSAICPGCPSGFFGAAPTCTLCPPGQWAAGGDKVGCENCPAGYHGRNITGAKFCKVDILQIFDD
jgi:hypothetical protein